MKESQKPMDLIAALELVRPLLTQIVDVLTPVLPVVSDDERMAYARPPQEFMTAAPVLVQAMTTRPTIAAVVSFNGDEVADRIEAATTITQVQSVLEELAQRLSDGRLVQLSEAWRQSLDVYGIAKQMERQDPTLRQVIEPMATIFRNRRGPAEATAARPPTN